MVRTRNPEAARLFASVAAVLALTVGVSACEPAAEPGGVGDDPTPPADRTPGPELDPDDPEPEDAPEPERSPPPPKPVEREEPEPVDAYGVSAGHPDAVDAGMQVLSEGGNAVDAAIAAAYAVSVVEPFASGIGGGGAALVHEFGEEPVAYDYREVVAASGQIPASDTGIPGFVRGMETLHEGHGSGDLADLLAPAIALAGDGAGTSGMVADQLRTAAARLPVSRLPHLFPGGAPLTAGEPMVQEDLAATLRTIADGGADVFYEGEIAGQLAERVGGIDGDSLAAYDVQRSDPVSGEFGGYEILGAAPPLPGAALIQTLQVAEALDVADHAPGSADFVHAVAMGWRLSEQSVRWDLGDPDFVDVPTDRLTDPERNADLAAQIPKDGMLAVDPGQPGGGVDPNTTHVTVVDAGGTVVSMTNTLTNFWGSGGYELGFFLNNQLARFDVGAGPANEPAPGRRSVSWSSPAVVVDGEGRPVLGIGSPGGRRILTVLAQVLARWALHGEDLADAVAAPRFHLEDTLLEVEEPLGGEVADDLLARGYAGIQDPGLPLYFGSVQALEIDYDNGELVGAADTRREAAWRVETP